MENQKSIQFSEYSHAPSLLSEKISYAKKSVKTWLNSKSEIYSRIAGYPVSWLMAIRIGIILPLLLVIAAVTVMYAPLAACISGVISAWIVYRLNQKGGGK
ncbi:MAG: Tat pathway signal protein [Prevotella sp.]|jgi:uncharacterized membrane protein|nr:Tat pathway signal protein [Prevotella sp.]MCH3994297.1 Tat pathway signal protein [Prevotella sp.]